MVERDLMDISSDKKIKGKKKIVLFSSIIFFSLIFFGFLFIQKDLTKDTKKYSSFENCVYLEEEGILLDFCSSKYSYLSGEKTLFNINVSSPNVEKQMALFMRKTCEGCNKVYYEYSVFNVTSNGLAPIKSKYGDFFNLSRMAFSVNYDMSSGLEEAFTYNGNYSYSLFLFDCDVLRSYDISCSSEGLMDLTKKGLNSLFFWEDDEYSKLINSSNYFSSVSLNISVKDGPSACNDWSCREECVYCWNGIDCTQDFDCTQGARCEEGICIPKE